MDGKEQEKFVERMRERNIKHKHKITTKTSSDKFGAKDKQTHVSII
jgi:hypothetical protein